MAALRPASAIPASRHQSVASLLRAQARKKAVQTVSDGTRPFHPWTSGQAERMNRTIKDTTTKAFHSTSIEQLQSDLSDYLWAYNSAPPLRALKAPPMAISWGNGIKNHRFLKLIQAITARDQTTHKAR